MATDDIGFTRDQVQRLNAVLAEYQDKYPPLGLARQNSGEPPDTPWLTDRNLMSPLLAEYDSNIHMMKEQIDTYQTEQKELRSQVDKLVAENKRLTRELKNAVETNLSSLTGGAPLGEESVAMGDDDLIQNLQQQLQLALHEKDSAMEMWQASVQEVERLEQVVQNQQKNPRFQSLETQANQIKQQYVRTVSELNNEITSLQEELRTNKNQLKVSNIQVTELRKTLEDMRTELIKQEQGREEASASKGIVDSRMSDLQRSMAQLQSKLDESARTIESLKNEKSNMESQILEIQKKSSEHEQREYEAVLQVRDSVQMVENAMLEKDQALVRERQATEEVDRLRAAISGLVDEAGARTRQEVDEVKKQCNQNIARLMEEIHALELETSEKQAQIDRAIREKRAAEAELEKLYHEGLQSGVKDASTYDDMNRRACNAERMRDETLVKLDTMTHEIRRAEMKHNQERNHLTAEVEQLKDRLALMNTEFESANGDRVKMCEKLDELKRKVSQAQQERDASQRNYNKELTCMQHDLQLREKEHEVKLQSAEDSHRHSSVEIRQMLAQQQRMSAKWKEECRSASERFESRLSEMRMDLAREKKRNSELTKLLKESRDKTSDAERMLHEYTQNIKSLENRVRDAEQRAVENTARVTRPFRKERDIVAERKKLQRDLERSLQESQVTLHSGSIPEPLAMSDLMNSSSRRAGGHFTDQEDANR